MCDFIYSMKKILLLFDKKSVIDGQADPAHLRSFLGQFFDDVEYTVSTYSELIFSIDVGRCSVIVHPDNRDLSEFDVIYFRRFNGDHARAMAAAIYAADAGVKILDSEILTRKGSITKLTQYMKLAINCIAIPQTLSAEQDLLKSMLESDELKLKYPLVMKIADATRGAANELVHDKDGALMFIKDYPEGEILVQEYIDNDGDYRVWVLGDKLGPVFYRQRDEINTHKNNTSQGASLLQVRDPNEILLIKDLALNAAKLLNREIAGVDVVKRKGVDSDYRIFEVNRAPQVEHTPLEKDKALALSSYMREVAYGKCRTFAEKLDVVGVSSLIDFVGYKNLKSIPVRIDSGARTSSLWASQVKIKDDIVSFKLFGHNSPYYTGKLIRKKLAGIRKVTSSTGHVQDRYVVVMSIRMQGKRLNAKFTLSDRSTQTYPILIGRNTLRGNFLVDSGDPGEAQLYKYPEEKNEFKENEADL